MCGHIAWGVLLLVAGLFVLVEGLQRTVESSQSSELATARPLLTGCVRFMVLLQLLLLTWHPLEDLFLPA